MIGCGWKRVNRCLRVVDRTATYLRVFKLLFDVRHCRSAGLAGEGTENEFWSDFARSRDGPRYAHKRSNLGRTKLSDRGYKGETMEGD